MAILHSFVARYRRTHAQDKFTSHTEQLARDAISEIISFYKPTRVISGGCHLGGVDIWAEEIASSLNIPTSIYLPKSLSWSEGYKPRNLLIASRSHLVVCVVVRDYPAEYLGMRFPLCYHCRERNPPHVKSGGCFTAWRCEKRKWIIV